MYYKKRTAISSMIFQPASLTLIGLIVIVLISLPLIKNIRKQISFNKEISTLEKEIADLEGKNTELKGLISYLNSDEFAEEQARLNLNYKKEGEEVLVIKDKSEGEEDIENNPDQALKSIYNIQGLDNKPETPKPSNIKKWVDYFLE